MFIQCVKCGFVHEKKRYEKNYSICSVCNHYGILSSKERIKMIVDEGTFSEIDREIGFQNPISFPGYQKKYDIAAKKTGLKEAIVTGKGCILGLDVMIGVMDSRFMMSSMGTGVGEKITRLFEAAMIIKCPVIIFSASGGARMQEGIISLMQMAKTSAMAAKFSEEGKGVYISVLTNPTTGGVSASFSFLGDIILAEPKALIGFAGRRVIEQTIKEKLPDDFQTAEYLCEHGFIDSIVERHELKNTLYQLISYHSAQERSDKSGMQ